jgi:intein/homing endonuclease
MKRLLRSVIDFEDGQIDQENLSVNFQRLLSSGAEWVRPDDERIYLFVRGYFENNLPELPNAQVIRDYFNRLDDIEAIERLKDIEAATVYTRHNFSHLLKTLLEDQNRIKMVTLLKETQEVVSKGLVLQEGREKKRIQGVRDALMYFTERVHDLIPTEAGSRTRGDIRADTRGAWDEYQTAKLEKDKVWGKFIGLDHIDKVCHGLKRGEMWVHAAFAGELKCLPGDAQVFDHRTHRRRTLQELYESKELPVVTALDREGKTYNLVRASASHLVQNGEREVFDLALTSGRSVGATSNHKFLTPDGWCELGSLRPGDWVAVPQRGVRYYHNQEALFSVTESKILGYLIGDGLVGPDDLTFTATNDTIREDFHECLRDLGYREGQADYETPHFHVLSQPDKAPCTRIGRAGEGCTSGAVSPVRLLLGCLGLWGCKSENKFIPDEVYGLPHDQLLAFVGALWSTDGSCCAKDFERPDRASPSRRNDITYSSKSQRLCSDLQSLLLVLGIQSTCHPTSTTYKGVPYTFWTVRVVGNPSKRAFAELIQVVGKEERFARLSKRLPRNDNRLIPSVFLPKNQKVQMPRGYYRYSKHVKRRPTVTIDEARRFYCPEEARAGEPEQARLGHALTGDLAWEQVVSVESRGVEMTYDLSVPEHHSFVVNDIITHNTTFALNWCYNLVTRYRTNVFYVSLEMPYEQLRRIICVLHSANGKFKAMGKKPLDYRKVRDGELSPEDEQFYQEVLKDFDECPDYCRFEVWSPDRDVTVDDIRIEAELLHKQMDVGFLVIDHGGLVEPRRRHSNYTIELNTVLKDSKKLALHFNGGEGLPVLMLFQINRDGKDAADKAEGKYKMRALSYANEAERSADVISTTYLNDAHRQNGTTMCCCLKNRDNPLFAPALVSVNFICRRLYNNDLAEVEGHGMGHDDFDDVLDGI